MQTPKSVTYHRALEVFQIHLNKVNKHSQNLTPESLKAIIYSIGKAKGVVGLFKPTNDSDASIRISTQKRLKQCLDAAKGSLEANNINPSFINRVVVEDFQSIFLHFARKTQ